MSLTHTASADTHVLASILNEIGASEFLQVFIDDGLDLKNLHELKPERISSIYGLWTKRLHLPTSVAQ
jgi:hypothetical protein